MLKQHRFYCAEYDWTKGWSNPQGQGLPNEFMRQQGGKVVFDRATGLIWQQGGSPDFMTYEKAEEYISQLNADRFAGFTDWRLPTLEEAMSLMETEKKNGNLFIDPAFDKAQWWIWTADKLSASRAWSVHFYNGTCGNNGVGLNLYVRAVRRGQSNL